MQDLLIGKFNKIIIPLCFVAAYVFFVVITKPQVSSSVQDEKSQTGESRINENNRGVTSVGNDLARAVSVPGETAIVTPNAAPSSGFTAEYQRELVPTTIVVDHSSEQNAFFQLNTIIQNDEQPENRLAAVYSLVNMLNAENLDVHIKANIKEALRMAATDGDPRVSSIADTEYKKLLKQ